MDVYDWTAGQTDRGTEEQHPIFASYTCALTHTHTRMRVQWASLVKASRAVLPQGFSDRADPDPGALSPAQWPPAPANPL